MTEKVDATVVYTFDKIEGYMEGLKDVLKEYGGDVAELGLNILRIDAAYNLVIGLIGVIIAYIGYKIILKYIVWSNEEDMLRVALSKYYGSRSLMEDALIRKVFCEPSYEVNKGSKMPTDYAYSNVVNFNSWQTWLTLEIGGSMVTGGVIAGTNLINIWYWIGTIWPEAYAVWKFVLS